MDEVDKLQVVQLKEKRSFPGNRVEFLQSGELFFDKLLELIRNAKEFIHIQVYILGDDLTGKKIVSELQQASARGVRIFLMVDDFGTSWMKKEGEMRLKASGIVVKRFSRRLSFKNFYLGRRQHSKIVVADNIYGMVGGMNLADRYSGWDGEVPWKDFGLLMEGPAVAGLNHISSVYWSRKLRTELRSFPWSDPFPDGLRLQISVNDLFRQQLEIWSAYKNHISRAKSEIFIIAAYFFPSSRMLRLILRKAAEGVKVRIILSSKSDVLFVKMAMEYYYTELLHAGVEIYEWDASLLHGKLVIVDGKWMSIGSYNLNQLSDFKSLETNVDISDATVVGNILSSLKQEMMTEDLKVQGYHRNLIRGIRSVFAYYVIRISLKILFLPYSKTLF